WRNCVRTPLLSEPLSILICTRSIAPCSAAVSPCHHAASVTTMKSLVLKELPKVTDSCPVSSSTRPHGIYFSLHPRSWSLALLSPRVCPPRENAPIFTVALQSVVYLQPAGNAVASTSGKIPPFHYLCEGVLPWYHTSFSTSSWSWGSSGSASCCIMPGQTSVPEGIRSHPNL